jgi:hypothetical protein
MHFDADPDPTFLFDPDPTFLFDTVPDLRDELAYRPSQLTCLKGTGSRDFLPPFFFHKSVPFQPRVSH